MAINIFKEKILEAKLNLFRIQLEKNTVVKNQHYEEAATLKVLKPNLLPSSALMPQQWNGVSFYLRTTADCLKTRQFVCVIRIPIVG